MADVILARVARALAFPSAWPFPFQSPAAAEGEKCGHHQGLERGRNREDRPRAGALSVRPRRVERPCPSVLSRRGSRESLQRSLALEMCGPNHTRGSSDELAPAALRQLLSGLDTPLAAGRLRASGNG